MVKTIIFDIGGVLIGYDWTSYMMKLFHNDAVIVEKLKENIFKNWNEVDRGVLSDEELLLLFAKDIPKLKKEIESFWIHLGDALYQYDFTKDWLRDLKSRGYQLLFLSNWSRHVKACALEQFDFLPLLDGGIFSYQVHLLKPEHAIFKKIIEQYHLIPGECVFLDDNPDNCRASRECGIPAIVAYNHKSAVDELESHMAIVPAAEVPR